MEKNPEVKKEESKETRETKRIQMVDLVTSAHIAGIIAFAICTFVTPWPTFHDFGLTIPIILLLYLGLYTKRPLFILGFGILKFVQDSLNLVPATYLLLTGKPTLYRFLGFIPMEPIPFAGPLLFATQWYLSLWMFLTMYHYSRSLAANE
jgi:hypothetical protein